MSSEFLIWRCEWTKKLLIGWMMSEKCFLSHTPYLEKSSHGLMILIVGGSGSDSIEWIESSSCGYNDVKRFCLGGDTLLHAVGIWCCDRLGGVRTLEGGVTWSCGGDGVIVSLCNLAETQVCLVDELVDLWLELIFQAWIVLREDLESLPNTLCLWFFDQLSVLITSISCLP